MRIIALLLSALLVLAPWSGAMASGGSDRAQPQDMQASSDEPMPCHADSSDSPQPCAECAQAKCNPLDCKHCAQAPVGLHSTIAAQALRPSENYGVARPAYPISIDLIPDYPPPIV